MKHHTYYHSSFPDRFKQKGYHVPIYKFMPFHRILDIVAKNELYVSQTSQWDDTYENFLAKADFKFGKHSVTYKDFIPCFYGQCWSLLKETDALWRIYSPEKTGVRIKSTIYKLLEASLNEVLSNEFATKVRVIGIVRYLTARQIKKWVENQNHGLVNQGHLLESLFIKRKEFSHEKEVRLIVNKAIDRDNEQADIKRKFIKLPIDPNDFIDEITFDPRIINSEFETYLSVLKSMGYNNKVSKSKLYEFNPHQIEW